MNINEYNILFDLILQTIGILGIYLAILLHFENNKKEKLDKKAHNTAIGDKHIILI